MSGLGICHLCKKLKNVDHCSACDHYFCEQCRGKYFERGFEAVKEMVGGKRPGCCLLLKAS